MLAQSHIDVNYKPIARQGFSIFRPGRLKVV
jgi:hypothetical protein